MRTARISSSVGSALGLILCAGLLGAWGCRGASEPEEASSLESRLPVRSDLNVIVVSFDALRPAALGVYGSDRMASPRIDAYAREALVFEHAYAVAPVTPTSFAGAFSGMLPTRVFHAWQFEAEKTLATYFAYAGFLTAAFVNNVQLTPERGFDRGFDHYEFRRNDPDVEQLESIRTWLREGSGRKFFLWAHFLAPHAPYNARPGAEHLYRETYHGRFAKTSGNQFETVDAREIARLEDLYLGEVLEADRLFGELLDALEAQGLLDSSLVVLTSDHGEEFGEHGGFQHGRLYEEHLRIPLILRHPGFEGGRETEVRARNLDLLPTLLHLIGHPIDEPLDGVNLLHPPTPLGPPVIGISMTGAHERWISILDGKDKLIVDCMPERELHLYDLDRDPGEQRDLYEQREQLARRLFRELGAVLGGPPCDVMRAAVRGESQTVGMDEESIEALRALGYIQ